MKQDWHIRLSEEINSRTNGSLEEIIRRTPEKARPLVQASLDLLPYTVALYTAMQVGKKVMGLL